MPVTIFPFRSFFFNSWKDFETSGEREKPFRKLTPIWVGESLRQLLFVCVHICATARNHWHSKMTLLKLSFPWRCEALRTLVCLLQSLASQYSRLYNVPSGSFIQKEALLLFGELIPKMQLLTCQTWQKHWGFSSLYQWRRGIVPLPSNTRLMELFLHIVSLCTINTFTRCF